MGNVQQMLFHSARGPLTDAKIERRAQGGPAKHSPCDAIPWLTPAPRQHRSAPMDLIDETEEGCEWLPTAALDAMLADWCRQKESTHGLLAQSSVISRTSSGDSLSEASPARTPAGSQPEPQRRVPCALLVAGFLTSPALNDGHHRELPGHLQGNRIESNRAGHPAPWTNYSKRTNIDAAQTMRKPLPPSQSWLARQGPRLLHGPRTLVLDII